MIFKGPSNEFLQLQGIYCNDCYEQPEALESPLTFLWFEQNGQSITIDNVNLITRANQVVCLTEFHKVDISSVCNAKMIRFNRSFYCVLDHDSEVGCKGILFFGASQIPTFE
ncbi:MAG: AraC family transcriptional regulator, partial [Flavobacteriales bacterium]